MKHHRTVDRVTTILEYAVSTPGGVALSDLSRILQAPKSSLHGLVQGLLAVGYLREQRGRLIGGPAVQALSGFLQVPELVRTSRERLEKLAAVSGESTMLGTRIGNNVIYQAQVESERPIRYVPRLLERRPLFTTALGRVFLAALSDDDVVALFKAEGEDSGLDESTLLADIAKVRESGVAYNVGLSVPGLTSVAAAINDANGMVIAGITVAGPTERMEPVLDATVVELKAATSWISRQV